MRVRVDPTASAPLHAQIADGLRAQIAAGRVGPGDRLPAARALADGLDVNVHTVLRAYGALRDDGLVDLRRGRGAVVRADDRARRRLAVARHARRLVAEARRLGVADAEVLEIVKRSM
jgi:DNA-binding transcriptional regulator YhcF (GntR family)